MRIVILGAGKIGAWLASELIKDHDVAVLDVDIEKTRNVPGAHILSSISDLKNIDPEVLINAVSLNRTIDVFNAALPHLSSGSILCDVASVKGDLPEFYHGASHRFVSLHPMFGPTFGNMRDLSNESAIIISESEAGSKDVFRQLFQRLSLRVLELSFAEHDAMMAYSLTLPFVSSMVFASCVNKRTVPGTTFKKHMDVAEGLLREDDFLLSEILFNPDSLQQLERISSKLNYLWHIVKQKDTTEAVRFFNGLRDRLK